MLEICDESSINFDDKAINWLSEEAVGYILKLKNKIGILAKTRTESNWGKVRKEAREVKRMKERKKATIRSIW